MAVQIMLKGGRLGMAVYKPVISDYYAPGGWVQITEEDGSYFDDKPVVTDPLHGMIVIQKDLSRNITGTPCLMRCM